jgi:hypothetical protein
MTEQLHGFYSQKSANQFGYVVYKTPYGKEVNVTNVHSDIYCSDHYEFDDTVYIGPVKSYVKYIRTNKNHQFLFSEMSHNQKSILLVNIHHVHPLEEERNCFAYHPSRGSCDGHELYSSSEGMVQNYNKHKLFSMSDIARYARDNGHDYFSLVETDLLLKG